MSATEDALKRTVKVAETKEVYADGTVTEKRIETAVEVHSTETNLDQEAKRGEMQGLTSEANNNLLQPARDNTASSATVIEAHRVSYNSSHKKNEKQEDCSFGDVPDGTVEPPDVKNNWIKSTELKEELADHSSDGMDKEEVILKVEKVMEVEILPMKELEQLGGNSQEDLEEDVEAIPIPKTRSIADIKPGRPATESKTTFDDKSIAIINFNANSSTITTSISIDPINGNEGEDEVLSTAEPTKEKVVKPGIVAEPVSSEVKIQQNCPRAIVINPAPNRTSEISKTSEALEAAEALESLATTEEGEEKQPPSETLQNDTSTKTSDVCKTPPAPAHSHQQPEVDDSTIPEISRQQPNIILEHHFKPPNIMSNDTQSVESVTIRATTASAPPTPPTRKKSTVTPETPQSSPIFRRPPSVVSSRANTMNYTIQRGRLSFPTLPRNTRPPRKEDFEDQKKKPRSMFSWLGGDSSKKKNRDVLDSVSEGLRKIYKQKLYPLEEYYKFHEFHSPALDDPDFDAKPMILLVGQYSTGKTTFIRYLLEQDFPGIRIGPEPTTDRFIAVMHGEEEGVVPGNALVVDAKKQFRALSGFGNAFLNRFQCSTLNNQVLESVTIVDTPGILSGEKQRIDRGYDFTGVLEWFAERVDRIILLFDAHKLDISDEFKRCIEALSGNEDKIRIVLNKSDMVDHQQLMRVYGALMWSLGKVFKTPEVSRVYIGTFWDHPLHYDINRRLFQDEQHDLFQDLQALPRNAALRKLNDLIKRARLAKVHAFIISELRKQMPSMIGKEKKKKELIQNLDKIFEQLQREHNISPGDFPDVNKMREKLQNHDFTRFNPLKPKLLEIVDGMLASDIARLMAQIPKEEAQQTAATTNGHVGEQPTVKGGAFTQSQEAETPFGFGRGEGFDKGADEPEWIVSRERSQADATFNSLGPVDGYLSGRAAKEHMVKSKLPNAVLGKIWKLADVDRDGQLDADEFALANYLINLKLEGHELPTELPKHLVPPSKRDMEPVYPKLDDE